MDNTPYLSQLELQFRVKLTQKGVAEAFILMERLEDSSAEYKPPSLPVTVSLLRPLSPVCLCILSDVFTPPLLG